MPRIKLLLDENIGSITARCLRQSGLDVKSIFEEKPGVPDNIVLSIALKERRLLVTLDRDFGRLVFGESKRHVGVIYLRLRDERPLRICYLIQKIVSGYGLTLPHRFVTVSEDRIRIR